MTMATFPLSNLELFTTTFSIPSVPDLHDFQAWRIYLKYIRKIFQQTAGKQRSFPEKFVFQRSRHRSNHTQKVIPTAVAGHWFTQLCRKSLDTGVFPLTLQFWPSRLSNEKKRILGTSYGNLGHIFWRSWAYSMEIFIGIVSKDKRTQNNALDCALLLNSIGQLVAYTGGEITDAREDWFYTGYLLRDAIAVCQSQLEIQNESNWKELALSETSCGCCDAVGKVSRSVSSLEAVAPGPVGKDFDHRHSTSCFFLRKIKTSEVQQIFIIDQWIIQI